MLPPTETCGGEEKEQYACEGLSRMRCSATYFHQGMFPLRLSVHLKEHVGFPAVCLGGVKHYQREISFRAWESKCTLYTWILLICTVLLLITHCCITVDTAVSQSNCRSCMVWYGIVLDRLYCIMPFFAADWEQLTSEVLLWYEMGCDRMILDQFRSGIGTCSVALWLAHLLLYLCQCLPLYRSGGGWQFAYRKDSRQETQENREEVVHTPWRWVRYFCRTALLCCREHCQWRPLTEACQLFWDILATIR